MDRRSFRQPRSFSLASVVLVGLGIGLIGLGAYLVMAALSTSVDLFILTGANAVAPVSRVGVGLVVVGLIALLFAAVVAMLDFDSM